MHAAERRLMAIRTTRTTVTFVSPFLVGDFDEVLPAGIYNVETDEERLEGLSFPAYRRKLTVIQLHAESAHPGRMRSIEIDPNELDAALKRDEASAAVGANVSVIQDPPVKSRCIAKPLIFGS
jgi:hypothetical protein